MSESAIASASSQPTPFSGKLGRQSAKDTVLVHASRELVFAVVGHVGSGTSTVAKQLAEVLNQSVFSSAQKGSGPGLQPTPVSSPIATVLKASEVIEVWAKANSQALPDPATKGTLGYVTHMQDLGDRMRSEDHAAVARELILSIRKTRADRQSVKLSPGTEVPPDGNPRAYILDSIRHPAEVELLRRVYGSAFALIGVVCEEDERKNRINQKYRDAGFLNSAELMKRDANDGEEHGQQVAKSFFLSDFFVDNTVPRNDRQGQSNPKWDIPTHLDRFVRIVTHSHIVRPSSAETAMYVAQGAAIRSACLSRQVGACLIDKTGNVISTGTNEVPQAGGGVYGTGFSELADDGRCAFRRNPDHRFCSNTSEQNRIVEQIIKTLPKLLKEIGLEADSLEKITKSIENTSISDKQRIIRILRKDAGIGDLLEFTRAVHAEMDALLTAARKGISTVGSRMFVTTYPCHLCAPQIVCAGVDEVQYIEPYPKSKAYDLHKDAIVQDIQDWSPPSQAHAPGENRTVLFHPFVGVAPRLYARSFLKDRELKDKQSGRLLPVFGEPEWGSPWHLGKLSYVQLEAELSKA